MHAKFCKIQVSAIVVLFPLYFTAATAGATPYSDEVLADSPVAYYQFDETGGTVVTDSSGNLNHGTVSGSLGFESETAGISLGTALDFTGGHISIPALGTFGESTVEVWIQPDVVNTGCCTAILATDGFSTGNLHFNISTNRLEYAVAGDSTAATGFVDTTTDLTPGTWYHLVVTNDNTTNETRIFVNGTEVPDTGDNSLNDVIFVNMRIGSWAGDAARNFDGRMDEFAIYDGILSPERIQSHYAAAFDPGNPDVLAFTASDGTFTSPVGIALPAGGGNVTLEWDVDDAVSVEIDNGALPPTANTSGSLDISVTADTTFTLTATNTEGTTTASVSVFVNPATLDPRLSEFMAENDGSLADGDGASSDWIEIYNPNLFPFDLEGHQLMDSARSWTFPEGSQIPALGYLVVFASGNNIPDSQGNLHTGFSLDNSGEYLALRRADNSVIDEFSPAFPGQYADISYGFHGEPEQSGYFTEPTPGASNGSGVESLLDKSDDTRFLFGRGFYAAPFDETITALTPGASIIYTLDGSVPTETNGIRVDAPDANTPPTAVVFIDGLPGTGVTTLRAIVFKEGSLPTNVDTQTYIFSNDVPLQSTASALAGGWPAGSVNGQVFDFGMNLNGIAAGGGSYTREEIAASLESIPSLSIVTAFENLTGPSSGIYVNALQRGQAWERPTSVELIYPGNYLNPDGNSDGFQIDCGLRIRGGYSRNPQFFKHGFRLFFRGEYGDSKLRFPLFGTEGAEEFDKIDLRSSSNFDWAREADFATGEQFTFARDIFSRDTQGAMGQGYTKSRYYHLYLNGTYWGIYQTEERPEASFGASYFGGDKDDYDTVKCGNHPQGFVTEATDGTLDAFEELWNKAREIGLSDPSDANYFALEGRGPDGIRDPNLPVLLDIDNLIDYMLVIFWTGDGDAVLSNFLQNNRPNNWFGVRNRNGEEGFRFFAHDAEHTLGASTSREDRTGPFTGSNQNNFLYANPQWIHQDLMANAKYRLRFADRAQNHFFRSGALTESAAVSRFNKRTGEVREALKAYAARWADARYTPSYNTGLWEAEIAWITNSWMPGRTATVLDQLRADDLYPAFDPPLYQDSSGSQQADGEVPAGFELHLALPPGAENGTIYYTTDGTDPLLDVSEDPVVTTTLVDFSDTRSYHVPTAVDDGFTASLNLSATPLAYYSFDTDASDSATANGSQDGTLLNGASISPDARSGTGALLLDGTDDYVSLGDPVELRITGQISIATWVKANAAPSVTFGNIIAKGYWLNPNSEIFLRYAGQIDSWRVASWDGNVHGTDIAGASSDIGQWIHLVGTYDGTHWNLYRNGVLESSTASGTGAVDVPNDWAIGARGTGTERFFNGYIDELYIFDTALNADDVAMLYTGLEPVWPETGYPPAAGWLTGSGGHGYAEAGSEVLPFINTNVESEMKNVSPCLLTRAPFSIAPGALSDINYLELNAHYDAGFVAYINGTEVCRVNAPAALHGESIATAVNSDVTTPLVIDLSDSIHLLNDGENVLAVHSLNESIDSSQHLIHCRLRAGQVAAPLSPSALEYTGSVVVSGPLTVKSRIFLNGEWSALTSAIFNTGVVSGSDQNLVISRIHYNPVSEITDNFSAKHYEFLEIMNISGETVSLNDLHFREEISFDFETNTFLAPGERAQIVSNSTAFQERYEGYPVRILGEYSGQLANEGGRLRLLKGSTDVIRDFSYDDKHPWPTNADGEGFSLVLIAPDSNPDHTDPANWRRSAGIHDTPGQSDAARFTGDPTADNDEDGLSALLEYTLGTSDEETTISPWTTGGIGSFEAGINRRVNADDAVWIPETSTDLTTWSDDPVHYETESVSGPAPGLSTEIYRLTPSAAQTRRYLRIRLLQR